MRHRAYRPATVVTLSIIVLTFLAPPAWSEPLDLASAADLTIDLTTDKDPVLELPLERDVDQTLTPPVVITLEAGSPLGSACDFLATDGLPVDRDVRTVTFTIRDAARCDLNSLNAEEVTVFSNQIDDLGIVVALKRQPSFPLADFAPTLTVAAGTAVAIVIGAALWGWFSWRRRDTPTDSRFWGHRLDSPKLSWSFDESWLSNLTALGALLATLLAATDVFDVIGPGKPERAVFLLINVAGLILTALALIAYLALRGHEIKRPVGRFIVVRVVVRAIKGNPRQLQAQLPSVVYRSDNDRLTDPEIRLPAGVTREWENSDEHVAALEIPIELPAPAGVTITPSLRCVGLRVPAAGHHDDHAFLLYDVVVPELQLKVDGTSRAIVPEMDAETHFEPYGRMSGFVIAGLLASVGVAIQLAAMHSILTQAELSAGADVAVRLLIPLIGLFAAAYVVRTIVYRVPEVESGEKGEEVTVTDPTPRMTVDDSCGGLNPKPVAPVLVINERVVAVPGDDPQFTARLAEQAGLPAYPTVPTSYLAPRTSPGDAPRRRIAPKRETAF